MWRRVVRRNDDGVAARARAELCDERGLAVGVHFDDAPVAGVGDVEIACRIEFERARIRERDARGGACNKGGIGGSKDPAAGIDRCHACGGHDAEDTVDVLGRVSHEDVTIRPSRGNADACAG